MGLSLKRESITNLNNKVGKKSCELKMNFDGIYEENMFVRQASEQFEQISESLSMQLEEVRVTKEQVVKNDEATELENKQLWKEANSLQEEKDKLMKINSMVDKENEVFQNKF